MLLQFCALGVTMSWDDGFPGARASRPHDEGFPGARASRPHQAWYSLGHLPHLDQPGTAPWLSFGLAAAVPAHRVAACSIALKLSGGQRDSMRAGRPRSRVIRDRMRAGRPRSRVIRPGGAAGELTGSTSVARGRRRPFGCDAAAPGKGRRPLRAPVRPGRVLPGDRLSGRTA